MTVEVKLDTPLAEALNVAIQPKLAELGWGSGGSDNFALAEYIILMLVNSKSQSQIAAELSGELLNLTPDDSGVLEFSRWLFEQIDSLDAQINGKQPTAGDSMTDAPQDTPSLGEIEIDKMDTEKTDTEISDAAMLKAPNGPRSMRDGGLRTGRERRMLGQVSKAMHRPGENALHRTRGNDRINTRNRAPPTGPKTGPGRATWNNTRMHNSQAGLVAGGPPQGADWMSSMQATPPNQMELMAILEQQNQMMLQLSQQLMHNGGTNGGPHAGLGQHRRGKSLFDRVSDPLSRSKLRRGQNNRQALSKTDGTRTEGTLATESEDVEMTNSRRDGLNADETVCKYNLNCTNKDCKFAHQSPAAPAGTSVDVSDTCSFGAACKNRKCVGRHPSPAARLAHQNEQDCKFFPHCQNPRCPFKHPTMPLCRNGPDCTTASCQFTHVKTKCRFNPCLNPNCVFSHDEGQQGGFKDKVWKAGTSDHVSERRFVDENAAVERVKADEDEMGMGATAGGSSVID